MKTEYDFFLIEKEHLKGKKIFPFQIYIFNPIHKKYSMFLNGNRPLTKELETFLDFILDKGGSLSILKKQRRTFLQAQEYHESEIPSLKSRELHALEKERLMNIKYKEIHDSKNGAFHFQSEFEQAALTDNFEKIIEHARVEILTFSVTHSHTVSLALEFAKKFLIEDNFLNRIVSVSYLLAKSLNIDDQSALGDIVSGAYLANIGFCQLPMNMVRKPSFNLGNSDKKLYEKHTILGHHFLKKSQIELSERVKKIILDHHERLEGGGYPAMKSGESIDKLSLLVGSISHLFELSSGKITGSKVPMKNIIINLKNKTYIPGLEIDFDGMIYNSLVTLINTDKVENKKAA